MMKQLWQSRYAVLPVPLRFIIVGMLCGLLSGLMRLHLGQSVDQSSTAGLVVFVSVTLGMWMGMCGVIGLLHVYRFCLRILRRRIDGIWELHEPENQATLEYTWGMRITAFIDRWSIYGMPILLPSTLSVSLYAFFSSHTAMEVSAALVWIVGILLSLLVGGLAVQVGLLGSMWRRITKLEHSHRHLNLVEHHAYHANAVYGQVSRIVRLVVGRVSSSYL